MTENELIALNDEGFIPGPEESEKDFLIRVGLTRKALISGGSLPREHLEWVRERLKVLYDFEPRSISAVYSNRDLTIWQGAACWIGEDGVPRLQLREGFRKGTYLGIYHRGEIVAHEAAHAARAAFHEPKFEEFFAFGSGPVLWRRVLGPIMQRPWEAWLLLGGMAGTLFHPFAALLETILIAAGFIRLCRRHLQLKRAYHTLLSKIQDAKKARAALFRMTDEEIVRLSRGRWIDGDQSLRWQLIRIKYFTRIDGSARPLPKERDCVRAS